MVASRLQTTSARGEHPHGSHSNHGPRRHERRTGARLRRRQEAGGPVGGPILPISGCRSCSRASKRCGPRFARSVVAPRAAAHQPRRRAALGRALSVVRAGSRLARRRHHAGRDRRDQRAQGPKLPDAREKMCFAVARELLANKRLSDATYAAAEKALGLESLVAVVATTGSFSMTCLTANTFAIEPPERTRLRLRNSARQGSRGAFDHDLAAGGLRMTPRYHARAPATSFSGQDAGRTAGSPPAQSVAAFGNGRTSGGAGSPSRCRASR